MCFGTRSIGKVCWSNKEEFIMMIVHSGESRTQEEQLRDGLEVLGAMLYNAELHPLKDGGTKIAAIQAQIRETERRLAACTR